MSSAVEEEGVSATDEREGAEGEEEEQEHDESSEGSSSEESGAEDDGAEDGGPEDEEEEDEAAAALPISKEQQEAEEEDLGKVCFICHAKGCSRSEQAVTLIGKICVTSFEEVMSQYFKSFALK